MADTALDAAFAHIARRIIPGARLVRHWPLTGGVSSVVHALEVASARGRTELVVRRRGSGWHQRSDAAIATEFRLLGALHGAGLPVPRPLLLDTSTRVLPTAFFVMAKVDGTTTIAEGFLDAALRQMARFLSELHRLDVQTLELAGLQRREDAVSGALEYLAQPGASTLLVEILTGYRVHVHADSLLHGDFWPGNMLWTEGQLAAVIDWEDTAIGPAVSDVACCRAELNVMFGASAAERFTQYYCATTGVELHDLPLWDFYVGSAALAAMHAWGLPPEAEAVRRERTARFVARATNALLAAR